MANGWSSRPLGPGDSVRHIERRTGEELFKDFVLPQAPTRVPGPAPATFDERRSTVDRIESMTGQVHSVQGFIEIQHIGETTVNIGFPVWFLEQPMLSFGSELLPGQSLVPGSFPQVSAVIIAWRRQSYANGVQYFSGATLALVVKGAAQQKMVLHWQVEGKALRNPIGNVNQSVDGTI